MKHISQKIYDAVNSHEIISFDIFDTLVLRDVMKPSDIFDIVEYKYNQQSPEKKLYGFKAMRIQAERTMRERKETEILLDEIYQELNSKISDVDRIKQIEVEAEYSFAVPNIEIKAIYNYALQRNKRIVLVSDMYLPYDLIVSILDRCGYAEYERLYLSSKIGSRKRNGGLFHYVLDDIQCDPKDILHIGDNHRSDYIEPIKIGIHAVHIRKEKKELYHYKKSNFDCNIIQNSVFAAFTHNRIKTIANESEYVGFSVLGLPLVGFCQWIHKETEGVPKYFLARDGFLIKKAYEVLYPDEKEQIHYLYISRNSLRRPNIYADVPYEVFVEQLQSIKSYSVNEFLKLCFVSEQGKERLKECSASMPVVDGRDELMHSSEYKDYFNQIKAVESEQYREQYDNLKEYLKQEQFSGKVAIIDVGWRGSAQINLQRICGNDVDITGYYFGVENSLALSSFERSKIRGYLWDWDHMEQKICDGMLKCGKGVFECMFLSSEGSTISYERDSFMYARPVLNKDKRLLKQDIVEDIQNGAIKFVREFAKLNSSFPMFQANDISRGLLDFIMYPKKEETSIGDIVIDNYSVGYLAKPKALREYVSMPKSLFSDLRHSGWKMGFLQRLFPMNRLFSYFSNSLYLLMLNR